MNNLEKVSELLQTKILDFSSDIYRIKKCPTTIALSEEQKKLRPKRIILVRHGQSTANATNYAILLTTPDNQIQLTEKGYKQALKAGQELKKIIGNENFRAYISPYMRTKQTFNAIMESLGKNDHKYSYDIRIREQEYGNLQSDMENQFNLQKKVGKLYYRFKDGESGNDVYNRAEDFTGYLMRMISCEKYYENIIIVTHELFIGYFIHNFLRMNPSLIEKIRSFKNCEYFILNKKDNGHYQFDEKTLFPDGFDINSVYKDPEIPKFDENFRDNE